MLYEFLQGQDVFSVPVFILDGIHQPFDHEDAQAADAALLRGEGGVRLVVFQRVIGFAGIQKFNCDLRLALCADLRSAGFC